METAYLNKRKHFSKSQKVKILSELESGLITNSALARKHGIQPVTIYNWKRSMRDDMKKPDSIDVEELMAENKRLKSEVTALKDTVSDLAVSKKILQTANDILQEAKLKKKLSLQRKQSRGSVSKKK